MPHVLRSIATALADDMHQIVRNRVAFAGGIGGLGLTALLLFAGSTLVVDSAAAAEIPETAFELEFHPGTLARLGEQPDEHELPQKRIVQDRRAPEPVAAPTPAPSVSTDDTAKPDVAHTDPTPAMKPVARDDRDRRIPIAPKPTHANTPHANDPATVDHDIGEPFGDPAGWDDLTRAGDPWATDVMKTLANMPVGWYAGVAEPGDFRFRLTICKDGSVERVLDKGGTMNEKGRGAVRLALETIDLPKPTAAIARAMPTACATLKHTFSWTADSVD